MKASAGSRWLKCSVCVAREVPKDPIDPFLGADIQFDASLLDQEQELPHADRREPSLVGRIVEQFGDAAGDSRAPSNNATGQ
jgi:hypothetical protein